MAFAMRVVVLHLRRGSEAEEFRLAERALAPAKEFCAFALVLVNEANVKNALPDTQSDIILCADFSQAPPKHLVRSVRWAVHHRHRPEKEVHAQLLCDLRGGDESRLKRKPGRGDGKARATR